MPTQQSVSTHLDLVLSQLAARYDNQHLFIHHVQQWLEHYSASLDLHDMLLSSSVNNLSAPSDVTDAQWRSVAKLLQLPHGRGRPYVDTRRTLNGIRYVQTTGCGWNHMPARYGNYVTCWRRLLRWQKSGIWLTVTRLLAQSTATIQHTSDQTTRG